MEIAAIASGNRVLDVASGRGAVLFPAAEKAGASGDAVGVGFAEELVRAANEDAIRRSAANGESVCCRRVQIGNALEGPQWNGSIQRLLRLSDEHVVLATSWLKRRGRKAGKAYPHDTFGRRFKGDAIA